MTGLPALQRPPEDAQLRTLVWFIVRRWWAGVHILPWQTVHVSAFGIHRYQEHRKTGARRVQTMRGQGYQAIDAAWLAGASGFGEGLRLPPPGPSAVVPPHGNRDLAELDATSAELDAQIGDLRERQRRAPSSPNVNDARVIATRRLTAMVNDAKATPIPALDELAAAIQAERDAREHGGGGSNAGSIAILAMLRRRLLTDPPSVNASEIFADLGIDPDPPPSNGPYPVNGHGQMATTYQCVVPVWVQNLRISGTILAGDSDDRSAWRTWRGQLPIGAWSIGQRDGEIVHVHRSQGQQSGAMWASVRAAKLAAARAGNPASPLRLVQSPEDR